MFVHGMVRRLTPRIVVAVSLITALGCSSSDGPPAASASLKHSYPVRVVNNSPAAVDDFTIAFSDGSWTHNFGSLAPAEEKFYGEPLPMYTETINVSWKAGGAAKQHQVRYRTEFIGHMETTQLNVLVKADGTIIGNHSNRTKK